MEKIAKVIMDKMNLKEIVGVVFVAGVIFSLIPVSVAKQLDVYELRNRYQSVISVVLMLIMAYYFLMILTKIKRKIHRRRNNPKRIAVSYMKKHLSDDEKQLLIETFYDDKQCKFNTTGYIKMNDGRKAALEYYKIIYRSANVSYYTSFAYNLQPYVLEYLNDNLMVCNIAVQR